MKRIQLKNEHLLCYPIFECGKDAILTHIREIENKKVKAYELRIDSMLDNKKNIDEVINDINFVRDSFSDKIFIATIRTKNEGGNIELSKNIYYSYIKKILCSNVDYVDIEYEYYMLMKKKYDKIIDESNKKVIISKHIFDSRFSEKKVIDYIANAVDLNCDCIKLAALVKNKNNLYKFIEIVNEYEITLKVLGKKQIFIAMGENGILSRVIPELTNSMLTFLSTSKNPNKLGQIDYNLYCKCRKLLAKNLIN